ncbi:hypothetical protein niasHS_006367 [Heterodera schachtii]|uniref:Uncharacterized protein n=2 Tax=Heterodera TaxID=34509 RepID=A0ABD2JWK1_HETSC
MAFFRLSECESILHSVATKFNCVTPVHHNVEKNYYMIESKDQPRKICIWEEGGDMIRVKGIDCGNEPTSHSLVAFFDKRRGVEQLYDFMHKNVYHFFVVYVHK